MIFSPDSPDPLSHLNQEKFALNFGCMATGEASLLLRLRCIVTTTFTDSDVARDAALLDAEELKKLRRFMAAEDRRDYAAAHALLRRMLTAAAPNIELEQWRFERTARGKPYLHATLAGAPPIRFSLSHTGGLVACVVSRDAEVGIDVECDLRTVDVELLMPGVCSIDEQAQVCAAAPSARAERFLDLWALKEAYVKARGVGIAVPLDQVSFDLRTPAAISVTLPEKTVEGWWLALIRQSADSRIAVAIGPDSGAAPVLDAAIIGTDGSQTSLRPIRTSAPPRPIRACVQLRRMIADTN
jgi:4'-phosphopantetheinyl transferase